MDLRTQLHEYAVELTSGQNYLNAGTVEFLVDQENRPYFIEVNPRIQVRHNVLKCCFEMLPLFDCRVLNNIGYILLL